MKLIKQNLLLAFILVFFYTTSAQSRIFSDSIYSTTIKTLKAYVDGNERSYPAIELNSDTKILIQFDDLVHNSRNYTYQIIHCNYDWSVSTLFSDEYMVGFNENIIQQFEYSTNTKIGYINYRVMLPNNDVQFKLAGNYVFRVFENGNIENSVLTQRFVIYETIVGIQAEVIRPLGAMVKDNSQEIKLTINHDQLQIGDPFNEIKVVIRQNNRTDRMLKDIKPVFVRDNELVYSFSGENTMMAGNEFRTFGFTNIHKNGINVNDIQYVDTIYHVQLRLDESRGSKQYFWEQEMNGQGIVFLENNDDSYRSADYAFVHFSLPMEEPLLEGKVYVLGELSQWKTTEANQMQYNFDAKMYEAVLLLKQGYYDYLYTYYNNYTQEFDETLLEGSHYQTENNYIIYVYHRGFSGNFDKLVGYQVVNSKYQN